MNIITKKLIFSFLISFACFDLYSEIHTIKMLNQGATGIMVFEPAFLKVNVGDTVTFESTDAAHNSASIPGMIPSGATPWNGQLSRNFLCKITPLYGRVTQLVRVSARHAGSREFESLLAHHQN